MRFFLAKNKHKYYNISTMEENTNEVNPAADVANAALAGATPIVTTTDETAADVAPAPALQMPPELGAEPIPAPITEPITPVEPLAPAAEPASVAEPTPILDPNLVAPTEPETTGPVSLAPSADFNISETATASALPNGADANLAAASQDEILIGAPTETPTETPTDEVADPNNFTTPADPNAPTDPNTEVKPVEEDQEPLVAAAPVPGSIGSAKSYADIQRAEAEKAARIAAKQGKKLSLSKNTIIIIAIAVVAIIGIILGAVVILSGNSASTPSPAPTTSYNEEEHDLSTLSCKRTLALEEYSSFGAISGTQENIFYFKDDTLDGLATNFSYTYANKSLAEIAKTNLMSQYGVSEEKSDKTEDKSEDEADEESENTAKTTAEMLHHSVSLKDLTVTHGMEIKSEDIEAWLASDAYSDVTYGATENGAAAPAEEGEEEEEETTADGEVVRNLKYYNRLQNSIDYDCQITKGY